MERKRYTFEEAYEASVKYFGGDELAARVWVSKYALKDSEGNIYELTPSDMHHRIASELAEGIGSFIDFSWMRNAFIADYLAEGLAARGFGKGALTSFDGFARNLEQGGEDFSGDPGHRLRRPRIPQRPCC